MHDALVLAVNSGMEFDIDDFGRIAHEFRMGYWADYEAIYTQAVKSNNISACHALEQHLKRKPFIAKFLTGLATYGKGRNAYRQEGRIAVESRFTWAGQKVTVTSFSKDGESLIACSYKVDPTQPYQRKIDKRYQITREELRKAGKRVRKRGIEPVAIPDGDVDHKGK